VSLVEIEPTFESWQAAARSLIRSGIAPGAVTWRESAPQPELPVALPPTGESPTAAPAAVRVPRQFIELGRLVARGPDPARWHLLYALLWRLVNERRDLLQETGDPQVARFLELAGLPGPVAGQGAVEPAPTGAAPFIPAGAGLAELQAAARRCTGCELHRGPIQTVFGQGPPDARIVLVGEQPGDQEDLKGAPFVGPAGEVLDRALGEVGLARDRLYVTNVVKHFKFIERGKRRIHQTPRAAEIGACRPWLEAELAALRPETLVCLGATAAQALLGAGFRLMRDRGQFVASPWAPRTIATLHPSAVLRGEDDASQARLYGYLVTDLRLVASTAAPAPLLPSRTEA
jgi:DNA polymerase